VICEILCVLLCWFSNQERKQAIVITICVTQKMIHGQSKITVIPILEPGSAIVVNNTSYQGINVRDQRKPNSVKMDVLTRLDKRDVRCRAQMTKVDLCKVIKLYEP
jgi:hypothetical protein